MPKPIKLDIKAASLYEMLDYLLSKTNIGASFYDADALASMNRLMIELRKDQRKFDVINGTEVK